VVQSADGKAAAEAKAASAAILAHPPGACSSPFDLRALLSFDAAELLSVASAALGVDSSSAAAVHAATLRAGRIPFRLPAAGRVVLVPPSQLTAADLASMNRGR
jgi:hypothetical protein